MPYPTDDPNVRLLTDLLAIPSPSGREEGMAAFIVDDPSVRPAKDACGRERRSAEMRRR